MNTPHKHAELIHAFADGKTLQGRSALSYHDWIDWEMRTTCPTFTEHHEWRIKPDEPKKETMEIWRDNAGYLRLMPVGFKWPTDRGYAVRIPELDREVTLP